jgi:hypothetical protein
MLKKYKIELKPNSRVIDENRNLVQIDPILIDNSVKSISSNPISSVANNPNLIPIPFSVTKAHSDIEIDKKYKQCFDTFSDKSLNRFAIAFYFFYVFIIIVFLVFALLFWNKFPPYRLNTGITHIFVTCMCVFQAITFCVFYEIDSPPSLDLFLRHLYRISTKWHGAFRNEAKRNYQNDQDFAFNYNRIIRQKPYQLAVVQNIFINFGIMILILSLIWIVAFVLYFLFLRIKKVSKSTNPSSKSKKELKNIIPESDKILSKSISTPSFMQRIALSFAFLIATVFSLSFTVEIMYYIFFEFDNSKPRHVLFKVSLACAVFIFLIHLLLILWVLAYPFLFLKKINSKAPQPPKKGIPNYESELKAYKANLTLFQNKYLDLTYLNSNPSKVEHAPYIWLFILQGLKFKQISPYFLGITSFLYVLYSMFLALIPIPPYAAIIINLLIILVLLGICVLFPLVNFLENIFLIAGYFLFLVGYILLFALSVSSFSGKTRCNLGTAISALFFLAWFILMIGVLYCLFNFCKYLFGKKAQYTAQNVNNVNGKITKEISRNESNRDQRSRPNGSKNGKKIVNFNKKQIREQKSKTKRI